MGKKAACFWGKAASAKGVESVYPVKDLETGVLFYGDNLPILREYIPDEGVDLVYLDPPFNSNRNYNVLFKDESGKYSEAQIEAFEDTWHWSEAAEQTYYELWTTAPDEVSKAMVALRGLIGTNQVMAYLVMMTARLVELHRVLKPTGSLYLHSDPTASHYLKVVLDAIFGPTNFRNEVVWKRTTAHSSAKKYAPIHDVILYYGKTPTVVWNEPRTQYDQAYLDKYYRFDDGDGRLYWRADLTGAGIRHGATGQPWRGVDPSAKGRHWMVPPDELDKLDAEGRIYWPPKGGVPQHKRYREELKGKAVADIWDDIDRINPVGGERLGYPTQKPLALLERIISTSSNPGDVVLDSFCGCGTSVAAAQKLGRRWIGIDITHLGVALQKYRLEDMFPGIGFEVIGEPKDLDGARRLAHDNRYEFQYWAGSLVRAKPLGGKPGSKAGKKGADKGIDGVISFFDGGPSPQRVLVQVKSGKVSSRDIRDLVGTVDREKAAIGVFLTLEKPTKPMTDEAVSAGFYHSPGWGRPYPRIQILTIEELLHGAGVKMPPQHGTFKEAQRAQAQGAEHPQFQLG